MAETKKAAKRTEATETWTDEEKAAMQEHAREMKASRGKKADGEADLLAKIAAMPPEDRKLAERIHALVKATAPELTSRTWYGMPAYNNKDGKLVCFFQAAAKFKARYATFGFEEHAKIDDGSMWPTSWAITTDFSAADEARLKELIMRAVS